MKYFMIALVLMAIACSAPEATETDVAFDEKDYTLGPVQQDELTPEQLEKISYFSKVFGQVDYYPEEEWVKDMKREADPEKEINVWYHMAQAFEAYNEAHKVDIYTQIEVYNLLMWRATYPAEAVLQQVQLEKLTPEQALQAMSYYQLEPEMNDSTANTNTINI